MQARQTTTRRELDAWEAFARESDLVWQDFAELSDSAKRAWDVLSRLGLRRRQQDVSVSALARWMGKEKACRAHEAIERLVDAGLLTHAKAAEERRASRSVRGRYMGCSLNDPIDALGPRRQSSYRQGEQSLPGIAWDDDDSTAESTDRSDVVRIRLPGADAPPATADPPILPNPARPEEELPNAAREAPNLVPNSALLAPNLGIAQHQLRTLQLGDLTELQPPLELSTCSAQDSPGAQELEAQRRAEFGSSSAEFGTKSGALTIADVEARLRAKFAGHAANDQTRASKIAWLRHEIPGLWLEIAEWVMDEVAGLHCSGDSRFSWDELRRIVAKTKGMAERGELTRPPAVYFTGACAQRFSQLGLSFPRVKPSKPK